MPTDSGLDKLPPVVQLLLREPITQADLRSPRSYLKRLLPELRRQAEWTLKNHESVYPAAVGNSHGLSINPSSGLDPFSMFGKCSDIACRMKNADQIARTIGLYADFALVGDNFTDEFVFAKRFSNRDLMRIFGNLFVLRRLRPLFEAGVFRFVNNFNSYCGYHAKELRTQAASVANEVIAETASELTFELKNEVLEIRTGNLHGFPLVFDVPIRGKLRRQLSQAADLQTFGRSVYVPAIHSEVYETIFGMNRAAPVNAVTFSNSRISVLTARGFDAARPAYGDLEVWEANRSTSLPWISELTIPQVIELRDSADKALPRFRERMARAMTGNSPNEATNVVRDLREEAAEVKAELDAIDAKGEGRFRTASALLGLTISVYGFAGEFLAPGVALGGLASLLGLLHTADHKERHDVAAATSRPGYVLVKARELVEHATNEESAI